MVGNETLMLVLFVLVPSPSMTSAACVASMVHVPDAT